MGYIESRSDIRYVVHMPKPPLFSSTISACGDNRQAGQIVGNAPQRSSLRTSLQIINTLERIVRFARIDGDIDHLGRTVVSDVDTSFQADDAA